jgi:hypothetical protein
VVLPLVELVVVVASVGLVAVAPSLVAVPALVGVPALVAVSVPPAPSVAICPLPTSFDPQPAAPEPRTTITVAILYFIDLTLSLCTLSGRAARRCARSTAPQSVSGGVDCPLVVWARTRVAVLWGARWECEKGKLAGCADSAHGARAHCAARRSVVLGRFADMSDDAAEPAPCPICDRPNYHPSDHRLVPKSKGGRVTTTLCADCHGAVHAHFTNEELRDTHNTFQALLSDERFSKDRSLLEEARSASPQQHEERQGRAAARPLWLSDELVGVRAGQ